MNRRSFLSTAATVAGAAAMAPLLSACGGGSTRKSGANTQGGLKAALPAYVPNGNAVKPDIASVQGGPDAATDPAYLSYPASPPASVSGVPGRGGSYTAVTPLWGTNPPAGNSFYQAMNKALGVELTVKPADGNTYDTIVPTMTAAKKLPDWINLPAWWNAKFNTGSLVGSQLADLTPYLSGDNIKKYPNLAALPTGAWQNGVWGDKLYGIPCFSTSFGIPGATFYRRDILEGRGIAAAQVKSADDLMNLGKELTDAKRGVWAFDDVWTYLQFSWGVPMNWRVDNGKLVHPFETQEFLEALDWHYRLATSGYMHPDALAGDNANGATRFYSGKTLIGGGGLGAWNLADHQSGTAADPNYRRGAFNAITADGRGTPAVPMGASSSMISYLNADLKPAQIEELLAVANYLAAPYGTAEYTLVNFGVEGVHHTRVNGVPTFTDEGKKDVQATAFPFLAASASVISNPGGDQVTKDYAAWSAANVKHLTKPPFWGMNFSMPQAIASAQAAQSVNDTLKDCYHGKKKVSDVQDAIAGWRNGPGQRLKQWMTENVLDKYGTGQ
ncbi:ABC transporter substrate-binding protein [Kitasatospora sp. DSM 101779]|uniref:ABC transporter substrate-binding protein n=1 Tax=Kitasatospora sp. DSM 101779 TaxID=2853165 RepID=UPI0021DAFB04|nr:Tat pathway signal sequence domain protein [Kitasatospora sp. DSM 101779]MCU7827214.1 extracellular solute-binding protein [Kitasatospora sp. DSM 101779]